jgi:pyruvate ferredoxin oxidoreductase delta subunit
VSELLGWKDMPIGGIIFESGSSQRYVTGGWRTYKPVHAPDRCVHCLRCWILCPDSAVLVENGHVVGFDDDHCKGCGICARECPAKCHAIEMKLDR